MLCPAGVTRIFGIGAGWRSVNQYILRTVHSHLNVQRKTFDVFHNLFPIGMTAMLEVRMGHFAAVGILKPHKRLIFRMEKRFQHHVLMVAEQKGDVVLLHCVAQYA